MARRLLDWLDTRRLATAILFIAIFAMAVRAVSDSDTWWHLQAGRVTIESRQVLQTDLFSHTRYGSPWVNHSWLSQVILFWLFDHFSYAGLELCTAALVTGAFALTYQQMEGDAFLRAFITLLAAVTSAVVWSPRPQLFSFVLTAAVAAILHLFKRRHTNRLWTLPLVFALWVNLHAGYALGFMVLAGFLIGEVLDHLIGSALPTDGAPVTWRGLALVAGAAALSALLLVLNPNTTRMWTYYLDTVGIDALRDFIQEWRSPDFHPIHTQPFIWLLLAILGTMGLSRRRADGSDLSLVGLFAYASLLSARNVAPFALVAAPVLSRHAAAMLAHLRRAATAKGWIHPRPRLTPRARTVQGAINLGLLAIILVLALLKIVPSLSPELNQQVQRENTPVDAASWIGAHQPPQEMFNPYDWGGYLIWTLWPDYQVFVDGRTDLYGDELLREYLNTQLGRPGFESTLDAYDVNTILTYSSGALDARLSCAADWEEAYRDGAAVIYVRRGTE
jgi:hypothetical protein